ncbi:MAG: hypothetical protein IJF96_05175 [Firmicutes bacterium]|nr:hypothetical protein [Bacillota bacterium]
MKIREKKTDNSVLEVTIFIEKEEFDEARRRAYLDNSDKYVVPGVAGGMATVKDLEKTYGPAVLFDEALAIAIPDMFNTFLRDEGIRIMGKPQVDDMQFLDDGVSFNVKADMYPEVELGEYKGIKVPYRREGEQEAFERAVIQRACENMKGEIPEHMVTQKLDSIIAREKINVGNEAIYHLLADALMILKEAYEAAEVVRPMVQVRREAMDLMLQTASSDHEQDWKEFFREQIGIMAERYHSLPEDFDQKLEKIISDREKSKKDKDPEEMVEEVFKAYLGSLELTEEQWKNQRQLQAAKEVCVDLLLDAVAEEEGIEVDANELHQTIESIADQCNMTPEEVEAKMDMDPLRWKLQRDKALMLVLSAGETDEEARAERIKKQEEQQKKMEDKMKEN